MLDWLIKHKIKTILIIIGFFSLPLILVNLLFKWETDINFLNVKWNASDILTYITSFEAFVGTLILGLVSLKQNENLNKVNNDLIKLQKTEYFPKLYLNKDKFQAQIFELNDDFLPLAPIIANSLDAANKQRIYNLCLTFGTKDTHFKRFYNSMVLVYSGKIPCNKLRNCSEPPLIKNDIWVS